MEYHILSFEQAAMQYGNGNARNLGEARSHQAEQYLRSLIHSKGMPFDLPIRRSPKGKPFFPTMQNLYFNITHSRTHIAIALSDTPVGIDLEPLRPYPPMLVHRYFHRDEADYLDTLADERKAEAFTRLWTLKEAYVKYTGTGMANHFPTFAITLPDPPYPDTIGSIPVSTQSDTRIQLTLTSLYLPQIRHYLAICTH